MAMLEELKTKLENLKVDEDAAWFQVVDREVQFEIIRLNTEDQLFQDGVDSTGADLPDYSDASINVYGKRPGHMTLKDTGEFYQSFVVRVDRSGINIIADTQKDDKDLLEYGEIIGLTEENIGLLRDMLVINYREYLRDKLFAA
jgi:hypothetical protein